MNKYCQYKRFMHDDCNFVFITGIHIFTWVLEKPYYFECSMDI